MKKILVRLVTGMLLIGTLAGCSGGASEAAETKATGASDAAANSEAVKTLNVVWFSDGSEGEVFMKLAEQYMQENQNIKIEMIEVPYDDLDNKLKNMINGGEAPALARMTNLGPFQNQLLDLGEYVSDKEAFINNFGEGLKFVYDDKVIAAPMDVTANGLIYNKTAFEQAGVEVPQSEDDIWTWDEFKTALQQVMDNSDCKYGMVFDYTFQRFSTLMFQADGGLLNEDLTESAINSEANKQAVEYFKALHDDGIMPTSVWFGSENPNELFRAGQAAVHWAGSWMVSNYKEEITDFEWGVTYLPKGEQRSTVPGGKWLGAFQNTGVEQEAADFIEWLSQAENNAVYCQENSYLSQVKGNESLDYEYGKEFFEIFSQELAATSSRPGAEWGEQEFTGAIKKDGQDKLSELLAGNITVDEYLSELDELAKEALADLQS